MKVTAHQEFSKEFVITFVQIASMHQSIPVEKYLVGMSGRVLLDFAIALEIDSAILARHPHGIYSEESSNNLIQDLAASILEKVGR